MRPRTWSEPGSADIPEDADADPIEGISNVYSSTEQTAEILATAPELSEDDRHRLLAGERRRVVIDVLVEREAITVDEIAPAVAGREDGETTSRYVRVALRHVHLPALADVGVLDYDPETNRVEALRVGGDHLTG